MALSLYIKNGDWTVDDATGRPLTISGLAKAKQDLNELLSIEVQTNGFGAGIVDLVGAVPHSPSAVAFSAMERISSAVDRWIGLQRRLRATLAKNETVSRLVFNQARVDDVDLTAVVFRAAILTQSGEEVVRGGTMTPTQGG